MTSLANALDDFELCGGLSRAEYRPAGRAEPVREPGRERAFGADDGEIDALRRRRRDQVVRRRRRDGEVGGERRRAGIPGSGEQRRLGEVAAQRPTQGVLAAAPADDQNSHFFLNASVNAWAARLAVSTTSLAMARASFM